MENFLYHKKSETKRGHLNCNEPFFGVYFLIHSPFLGRRGDGSTGYIVFKCSDF
jgi:hypothetical protein